MVIPMSTFTFHRSFKSPQQAIEEAEKLYSQNFEVIISPEKDKFIVLKRKKD